MYKYNRKRDLYTAGVPKNGADTTVGNGDAGNSYRKSREKVERKMYSE